MVIIPINDSIVNIECKECIFDQPVPALSLPSGTTHHWGKYHCTYGWPPVLQVWIKLHHCMQNIAYFMFKSYLVKLETSNTVILPPMVSVLCSLHT